MDKKKIDWKRLDKLRDLESWRERVSVREAVYLLSVIDILRERNTDMVAAIVDHWASTGHEMCHENDSKLWEATIADSVDLKSKDHTPPEFCEFMSRCLQYRLGKAPLEARLAMHQQMTVKWMPAGYSVLPDRSLLQPDDLWQPYLDMPFIEIYPHWVGKMSCTVDTFFGTILRRNPDAPENM